MGEHHDHSIGTTSVLEHPKANISLTFNSRSSQIGCELYIKNDEFIYSKIQSDKEKILADLGDDVEFMDLPGSSAFRIIKTYGCDPFDENKWNEYFEWLNTHAAKFQKTFKKYF
jgi:hypothetical protein